ncbi:MAG: tripartite tricarboxylate transporter substrate-binding protein [Deltaproteobacteria bacterium]|nr:tripartite tricarboxylate transporter substrate-binding protein [Deltaproteobacteria bacterium]
MIRKLPTHSVIIMAIALACALGTARAAMAERFYEGKTIRFIVPYGPGGGFDVQARLMARYLPRYIAGKPTVIVQNMPGGGGSIGPNYVYNVSKPDGLTIGMVHGNQSIGQMTKLPGRKFKMEKFSWIGGTDFGPIVLAVKKESPYRTIDDLRKAEKPLFFAAASRANNQSDYPVVLREYGGLNFKVVLGYRGSASGVAAIQRGEADGMAGSLPALLRYTNDLRIIIGNARARSVIPDLIVDDKIVTSKEGRSLINALKVSQPIGRGIMAPPGVPQERLDILRGAWNELRRNTKFLRELEKATFIKPEDLKSAQEVNETLAKVRAIPQETWKVLRVKIQMQ